MAPSPAALRVSGTSPGSWKGEPSRTCGWFRREQRHGTDELYEYGTSIRFPDPACGGWRSTWLGPIRRVVRVFLARPADGDVVLETRLEDGRPMQWRFSDITPTSFSWSNATEQNGEWIVTQRFTARRVPDTSLP